MSVGIFLEDQRIYLPWGIACDNAWKIGNPKHYNDPLDKTRLTWSGKILNGLNCDLLAYLPNDARLDKVTAWLNRVENDNPAKPIDQYSFIKNHLSNELGNPSEIPTHGSALVMPILTWLSGKCTLQLYTGDRFGEFTMLEINQGCKPTFVK